ncbi:MAG: hypothetical protein AAF195_04520 [Pseudomonadota bacterium]
MKKYKDDFVTFYSEGMINGIEYYNFVQFIFLTNSLEEEGLWDAVAELSQIEEITKTKALELLKSEIKYFEQHDDMYLIYSKKLYDTGTSKVLDKKELLNLTLEDVEFKEEGPFYYFSTVPEI